VDVDEDEDEDETVASVAVVDGDDALSSDTVDDVPFSDVLSDDVDVDVVDVDVDDDVCDSLLSTIGSRTCGKRCVMIAIHVSRIKMYTCIYRYRSD
jgi:hypothetical protein